MPAEDDVRLTEGASAYLDCGEGGERIGGEILAFFGAIVLFRPAVPLSPRMSERFADGVDAFLLVSRRSRLHALSGRIVRVGEVLGIALTDSFRLGQRRRWSRADLRLAARLTTEGAEPIETTTIDVSPAGARVEWPAHEVPAEAYRLELTGGALEAPVVAGVVRSRILRDSLGVRFTSIDPADRGRLTVLALDRLAAGLAAPAGS